MVQNLILIDLIVLLIFFSSPSYFTDVDECKDGSHKCPDGRRCQNTYGNFICLCRDGFKFQYVDRKLVCVGKYMLQFHTIINNKTLKTTF